MRTIPSSLASKFKKLVQAESTKAAPALDLWISRPVVPLVNDYFLEKQALGDAGNVTALDIAVCHPRHRRQSTRIFIATVENGRARVKSSPFRQAMETHLWVDSGFSEPAEDVAIAFDAATKNDTRGRSEFVTEEQPWVFWVSGGALYGRVLGSDETLTLAETNCTKCTAIRAAGSALGGFDYGLCLFFLLNGAIYIRQYMDGEWMDAEPVNFGPAGVTWTDIAASRSWDYRVILQAMASDGMVYELYTQYMGIGQRGTEHIEVKDLEVQGKLTEIRTAKTVDNEHIEVVGFDVGALYGGLYSTLSPSFVSAKNIPVDALDDEGVAYQEWGKVVLVTSSVHIAAGSVAANANQFTMTDSAGKVFVAASAELDAADGLTIRLTFADFNKASGACVLSYSPGTMETMAGTVAESASVEFTPENLVAPSVEAPIAVDAWAIDPDGTKIVIRFTEDVTVNTSGEESNSGWSVSMMEYDRVPGGTLQEKERIVTEVSGSSGTSVSLDLSTAALSDVRFSNGKLVLEVSE